MALFESYERRIDKINEVLNSYGIRTPAGLTLQARRSRSRKAVQERQTQRQRSEKVFRLSVSRDLLLTSAR